MLAVKYSILFVIFSDRALLQYLIHRFEMLERKDSVYTDHLSKENVTRRVYSVLNRLFPRSRCLLRSIVLNEILILRGHNDQKIKFGLKKENSRLQAHAWVFSANGYEKIFEL